MDRPVTSAQDESDMRSEWTRPGAYLVAPGVHRVPLPLLNDSLRAVNVYVIDDGDEVVLIDSGWALPEARILFEAAMSSIGHPLESVTRFLITHVHRDHYTQAVALRREFPTRIAIGAGERPSIEHLLSPEHMRLSSQIKQLHRAGAEPLITTLRAAFPATPSTSSLWDAPDDWLNGRDDIMLKSRTLAQLPTPGHTQGHLCFRDEAGGLLFSGDHVLPHITPSIGFEPSPTNSPLADYLQSLRRVRELPDTVLLPAHGPVCASVHDRVDELFAHHASRLDASLAAIEAGATTTYETTQRLTWTKRERSFRDLDPFNQMLAVVETAAHLDVLVTQGRLRCNESTEAVEYCVV